MIQNKELNAAVQEIMMLGADCTTLLKFSQVLNMLAKAAAEGDVRCVELLSVVYKFAALVKISQK